MAGLKDSDKVGVAAGVAHGLTDGMIIPADVGDYESREEMAVKSGKDALKKAPWLFNRANPRSRGFFFELKENDAVHPDWYAIHCVDGVGTKLFLSAWSGNYGLQPIDAVAMNSNDMATSIRAYPDVINLYFAVQAGIEESHMGEIMSGFVHALEEIRIPGAPFDPNVGKIETASLDEMISLGIPNKGWDVGVVMSGFIRKDEVPNLDPRPGHIIVGVSSTGCHSNGFTSARHVLFTPDVEYREEWKRKYWGRFGLHDRPDILKGASVLEALQAPTALYTVEAAMIGKACDSRDVYGVNITGNGLANFNRAGRGVSFEITDPLAPLPIHELLVQESGWSPKQAYVKQNMGMGFAFVVPSLCIAECVVALINERGEHTAKIVGEVARCDGKDLRTTIHKPYEGEPLTIVGYNN
jgi:phosphoribosylformylglycinamidine cyclo-ligase